MNGILIKPVNDHTLKKVISQWVLKEHVSTAELSITSTENQSTKSSNQSDEKIFSLDLAKTFTGNNEELAYELFNMLQAESENYTKAIKEAVDGNDLKTLRDLAHKLHGSSRCCGTTELKNVSSHLESLIDNKINFDLKKETSLLLTAIQNVADYNLDSNIKS